MIPGFVVRDRRNRIFSVRIRLRALAVGAGLSALLAVLAGVALTTGDFDLPLGDALQAVFGQGTMAAEFVVDELRMPRILTAVLVGAALAVSGAIMQSLTRNALGSPDIIGFTNGSATGALVVIILLQGGMTEIAIGSIAGGLATALAVFLLAYGRGAGGFRLVVMGIGVGAMLLAANSYLITRASWQEAVEAQEWLVGSLNNRTWDQVQGMALACAVLMPIAFVYGRRLALLEMGDDAARALGVDAARTRLVLVLVSVTLAAVATAATGPVLFVALAAPQLARRLTGTAGPGLAGAALMGAVLLLASDLAAQRLFTSGILPVGVATGTLGGLYLMGVLVAEARKPGA
ncbi:FecCD family ABC transporter permease [Yinghuangia soli]|uniref:Iron chelate uptake ABC transporter family permease subunit n=1 Tax=Yinghuangia soli TaxID=2908204 RepID=A0AA41PVR1_9ACTN|nr:iron chelate uptake ABC transporter family permease subunit [Yinghuangia soli]MCF2526586.1 iron chelate uptake ABC transporter family permease subunit [Yinghuangia soli]